MDPNAQLGKGLYIWYIKNGNTYPPEIYSIQADGGFKWQFAGRRTMYGWNTPPPVVPLLERGEVYRYLPNDYVEIGKCDRNKLYYYATDLNRWEYDYRWWDRDPLTKEWVISRDAMGDEADAFNINSNDQITPWSNPSTTKFVNNTEILTGISVKILAQNGNDLIVRVYTSVSGSLSLPPSKPQRLSVSKNALNQAVLTWSPNIEPDVISGGRYKIYRASSNDNNPPQFWTLIANVPAYKEGIPVTSFTDVDVYVGSGNSKLFYRITAVDNTNLESKPSDFDWINWDQSMQKTVNRIYDFELNQNYPNPFNPVTKIRYTLKETNPVMIKLYDIVGREVATLVNEVKDAGEYEVELDAGRLGLSSGVYFYQMKAGEFTSIKKMVVLK
ncbi:MAG: T9SS type A sorting domain-containing protein [Ignavibacteria bacterium]|nr:T9SS type A sorting domain-containing protein [Ignavibacteria bacterium]